MENQQLPNKVGCKEIGGIIAPTFPVKYSLINYKMLNIMKPEVGNKIRVKTKLDGDKLCIIDLVTEKKIHFKNKNKFGLTVNIDRIKYVQKAWKGANFEYTSFN